MSAIKRWIDDFVESLATAYGYDWGWLLDKFMFYCVTNEYMTKERFAQAARQHIFYDEVLVDSV